MKWAFTFIAALLFFAIFLTPQYASTATTEIAQRVPHGVELERKTQARKSFDLKPLMTLENSAGRALSANWSIPVNATTVNPVAVTLTGAMSPSSAIVGVTQVSLVGNATPGATVSETDVGPDGKTNGPFTTVATSSGTYNLGPFLLTQLGTYTGTLRDSISGQTKTITYSGTGDFSASVNTTSRTITAGQSTSYTVTFSSLGGFSGVVTPAALNWSNVPGATASWSATQVTVPSNGSVQATFTIQTVASTTAGTYGNIILSGKNGAFTRGVPAVSLTVNAATVTLTGAMSPSSAIVGVTQVGLVGNATPGATVSETDVGPDGKTNGPFTTVVTSSGTYNLGPFLLTQLGTYTGTLRDSISGQTKTITYSGTGDFSASVNTTSRTITAGQSTSYTVTFSSLGGFSGVVTPAALNWSNVPGATASWSATQVTVPSNGSVQATFTIQTAASTAAGTYGNIILSGKNGAFTRGVPAVSLTVNAATVTLTGAMSPSSAIVGVTQVSLVGNATPGATISETDVGPDGKTNGPFTTVVTSSGTYNLGPFLLTQLGTYTGTLRDSISGQTKTITYSGTGDFSASVNTTSRTITAGQSASYTVTFSSLGGFSGVVTPAALNWSNVPGATASWSATQVTVPSNGSVQATFTIQTATSTTAGTYNNIILNGKNGLFTRAASTVSVTVNPATVTLTGAMSPSSAIVGVTQVSLVGNATPGATVSETDVGPDGKTNGPFTTVATSSGTYNLGPFLLTQLGTYTGTLRDSISGQTKTITYSGTGDFSASVNTTSRTITAGQSTSYTVTFSSLGGFSGVVTPAALNWSNVPGATASWSPTQVTVPSNSSVQATFTIQTMPSTTAGTYGNIMLNGKNGSFTRAAPVVSLTVNAATSLPTISNMTTSPNPPLAGQFNFTITGLNYNTSNAEVFFIGPGCSTSTSCVVTAVTRNPNTLAGSATLKSGYFTVQVRNGSSGTPSGTWPLVVNAAANTPTISNMTTSPNPPVAGQFNFTITGLNYNTSNAEVFFIGPGCSTSTSCVVTALTRNTNTLSGPATLAAGSFTVQVRNGPTGTPSGSWPLTVNTTTSTSTLQLFGIEITQGIQNLRNDVVLIQDKPTFARVYVNSLSGNISGVSGRLIATRLDGTSRILLGERTLPQITVLQNPVRSSANDSFNLQLPQEWRRGTVEFEFQGVNRSFRCVEPQSLDEPFSNPDCKVTVVFQNSAKMQIQLVSVVWSDWSDLIFKSRPNVEQVQQVENELRMLLPIPDLDIRKSEFVLPWRGQPTTEDDFDRINRELLAQRTIDGCSNVQGCKRYYLGLLAGVPTGGIAGQALVNSATCPNPLRGDVATSYITRPNGVAPFSPAHEVGHLLGRYHTDYNRQNGLKPEESVTCAHEAPDGTIGGTIFPRGEDVTTFYGFDGNKPILPATPDLMSYGHPAWISRYTYTKIWEHFSARNVSSQLRVESQIRKINPAIVAAGDDAIMIIGSVSPQQGTGKIESIFTIRAASSVAAPDPGTYAVRFENSQGQELNSYAFEPSVSLGSESGSFAFLLPRNAGVSRIVLLHNGQVIDTRTASVSVPTVMVTYPNGGESLIGSTATLQWTAGDADGSPLAYLIQYSADRGSSWQTLATNWPSTSYELNLDAIAGTTQGLIRVLASDGFNTAEDQSNGVFNVNRHVPQASIQSPQNSSLYVGDQTIILEGGGFDLDDGQLSEVALTWSSNLNGTLGTGRSLSVNAATLTEGTHIITLTARDSDGQIASASIAVQISRARPAMLASLAVAPSNLSFLTGSGNTETAADIIAIRNNGDGTLNWSATADQTWIHLAATSGSAPANLFVSTNPSGLAAGQYVGHVNITSSEAPNASMAVTITLSVFNIPQVAATIFTEQDTTNRAAALDSVTWLRGPFRILTNSNFSADHHTRVILFTSDLGLTQPDPSQLTVRAGGVILTVENVGPLMGVNGLSASYIIVRLPDALPAGDLPLVVTLRGVASVNSPALSIAP